MLTDFAVNILASVVFFVMGLVGRQALSRYRSRATRSLWRSSIANGLTIAITTRDGGPTSGTRASFEEVSTLIALIPMLSQLRIEYNVIESLEKYVQKGDLTGKDVLFLGGPDSNILTEKALARLAGKIAVDTTGDPPTMKLSGRLYELQCSADGTDREVTYGLLIKTKNPFGREDSPLTATLVVGLGGIGTSAAARLLADEDLVKKLPMPGPPFDFAALVRCEHVSGKDYDVRLEKVWRLDDRRQSP